MWCCKKARTQTGRHFLTSHASFGDALRWVLWAFVNYSRKSLCSIFRRDDLFVKAFLSARSHDRNLTKPCWRSPYWELVTPCDLLTVFCLKNLDCDVIDSFLFALMQVKCATSLFCKHQCWNKMHRHLSHLFPFFYYSGRSSDRGHDFEQSAAAPLLSDPCHALARSRSRDSSLVHVTRKKSYITSYLITCYEYRTSLRDSIALRYPRVV